MRLLVCPAVAQSVKFLWSIAAFTFIVSNSVAVEPKHDEHDEHCDCGCEHDENK